MAEADLMAGIIVLAILLVLVAGGLVFMILRLRSNLRRIEERSKPDLEKQDTTAPLRSPAAQKRNALPTNTEEAGFPAEIPDQQ
jgi:hypothetical protein